MFRCDSCEDYIDKSEACENPDDDYSCICWECLQDKLDETKDAK